MKILNFKGRISLKNKILIIFAIILVIAAISVIVTYMVDENARDWININILKKEITEDDVATIYINSDKAQYVYAYDKYIVILSSGKLETYNSYASRISELDVQISNPLFEANGSQLVVAEKDGQRIYLISDRKSSMGKQSRGWY